MDEIMDYDELFELLIDLPRLNPRLEKRNTVCGIKFNITLNDLDDDFKTRIIDESFTDVNTKQGMLFVIKDQLENDIEMLQEILAQVIVKYEAD